MRSKVNAVCTLVFLLSMCVSASAAQRWLPYTQDAILDAVREGGMSEEDAVERISEAGVSFRVDDPTERSLLQAGLSPRIVNAARENMRPPVLRKPEARPFHSSIPLSEDDIVRALRSGTSPDALEAAVERAGVSFRLEPAAAERIELAGGTLSLIGMIGLRQPSAAQCVEAADVIVPARVVNTSALQYPVAAQNNGLSGTVRVRAVVAKDGTVADAAAVQGHKLLARAAEDAVREWTWEPARRGGRPVDSLVETEVRFLPAE